MTTFAMASLIMILFLLSFLGNVLFGTRIELN